MRILIVEDEAKLARVLSRGFETQGFAVDVVDNGDDAISRISLYRKEYDAIILDLMIPGKSGEEVCEAVRSLEVTTPIIVLTARDDTDTKVKMLNLGADDYLPKPFSFAELLARVQALMRRPSESKKPVIEVGDLSLDPSKRTVTATGEDVTLTLKEFAILEYFMRQPDVVHSRDDILDHVWDFNFDSFSNIVDVHVKNLRKKLAGHSSARIETVRGVGYRLVA